MLVAAELRPLGRRMIMPGVLHFLRRAGQDSVAGAVCSAAALAAAEALDAITAEPLPNVDGVDQNPFTRRKAELTPTAFLRALRPASAHYLISLIEDRDDSTLLASLMGIPVDEAVVRLFSIHADVFELGRESQLAIADYWSRVREYQRYTVGIWGLVTAAAFGVRHLQEDAATAFRAHLDARMPSFGRRVAENLRTVVAIRRQEQADHERPVLGFA